MQTSLVIGETLNYTATVADYPATDGWGLRLLLNPRAGGAVTTVNSAADGDAHLLQVSSTTTAALVAGDYAWEIWAIKDAEQYRLDAGQIKIVQGLIGAAAGTDNRTQAQKALDDAKTALAAWSPTAQSYSIGGRSMTFRAFADVEACVRFWQAEVINEQEAERRAAGLPSRRKVHVRMVRA